jgi:hypothetical protein
MRFCTRMTFLIAVVTMSFGMTACKRHPDERTSGFVQSALDASERGKYRATEEGNQDLNREMAGVFVDPPRSPPVQVEVLGVAGKPTVRLATRDLESRALVGPMVDRLAVYRTLRRRSAAVCEIAVIGTDQTRTMNEWRYGETPSGYRGRPCRPLGPGEYEVTVLAGPATGQARFRVVNGGGIEGLPWEPPAAVAEVERLLRENDSNRRKTQKREADAVERSIAWPPQDSR